MTRRNHREFKLRVGSDDTRARLDAPRATVTSKANETDPSIPAAPALRSEFLLREDSHSISRGALPPSAVEPHFLVSANHPHLMQIIATSHPTPFLRSKVLAPGASERVPAADAKELLKAAGTFTLKNVTATGVGGMAWKLTTVPQSTSQQELATLLANNNISPDKAPAFAHELRELLGNPALRALLIGVSGGAVAYLVVEKTSWSQRTKWLAIIGVGIVCSGIYLVLRHYGIMK